MAPETCPQARRRAALKARRAARRAVCARAAALGAAVLLAGLAGCAGTAEVARVERKPPAVRLGPTLDLAAFATRGDPLRVVPDGADGVFVLIASKELKQVLAVHVLPAAIGSRHVLAADRAAATIDGIVDERRRLLVLAGADLLVVPDGDARPGPQTPWREHGVPAEHAAFVHGAPSPAWTFTALGRDIGATGSRWVWRGEYGAGPAPAFVVYPWKEATRKAVLVGDGATAAWWLLPATAVEDTQVAEAVADAAGNVHVLYARGANVDLAGALTAPFARRAGKVEMVYVRTRADLLGRKPETAGAVPAAVAKGPVLAQLAGERVLPWAEGRTRMAVAVDAATGTLLLQDRWLIRNDRWIALTAPSPFADVGRRPEAVASAGGDAFHAIGEGNIDARFMGRGGIMYARLANGEWSAPLWLGLSGTGSLLEFTSMGIASNRSGDAFAAWSTATGIVGRWIERAR